MIYYYIANSIIIIYSAPSKKTKDNSKQQTNANYLIHHHEITIFNTHALAAPFVVFVVALDADVASWAMVNVVAARSELAVNYFALFAKFESEIVFL